MTTISISRNALIDAVKAASKVIDKRHVFEALRCARVRILNGNLVVSGVGPMGVMLSATLARSEWHAESDSLVDLLINAQEFLAKYKRAKADHPLSISTDGEVVTIKDQIGVTCKFLTHSTDDYPDWQAPASDTIEAAVCINRESLAAIAPAMAKSDVRRYLIGLGVDLQRSRVVATDGHRVAYASTTAPILADTCDKARVPIIQRDVVLTTLALAAKNEAIVIEIYKSQAIIRLDRVVIVSDLIEGRYPNYERVIAMPDTIPVSVGRRQLLDALQAVKPTAEKGDRLLPVKLKVWRDTLELCTSNATASIVCATPYVGNEMVIGFNYDYLIDLIKAFDDDTITLLIATDQCLMRIETDDRCVVVMAMRV